VTERLEGRVALVTGSGQGIGRATVRRLAAEGARVAVNDVVAERVERVVQEIAEAGGTAVAAPGDVTDRAVVGSMVGSIAERLGPVEILVNNAGGAPPGAAWSVFAEASLDDLSRFVEFNLGSALLCTRAVINPMIQRGWGKVVCVSSISATWGQRAGVGYAAGKAGLHGFVRSLAKEVAVAGVNANGVVIGCAPHPSRTPEREALINTWNHFGRHGTYEEFASAIAFLCSDDASYLSGTMLEVDGGITKFNLL
jgi:NAD(P)-dependent dehydrogenase (short-subunit alcohol dehydrogenase family)